MDSKELIAELRGKKWMVNCEMRGLIADDTAERAAAHIAAQDARMEALEGALQFYANNASYCMIYGFAEGDPKGFAPVLQDDGTIAKAALGGEHGG